MTRNSHRWLGWIVCALGPLLASQLAQAGSPCVSISDQQGDASLAATQVPCTMPGAVSDDCLTSAPRIDTGATAPLPPQVPSPASALDHRPAIVQARAEQESFGGPAPGSRLPLHILFHRQLI